MKIEALRSFGFLLSLHFGSPKHLNFTEVSQYQFQHWTHCGSVQRCQNFNEWCPSHHNWKHHLYHSSSGILSLLCLYMSSWLEIYTHTHKQYSLGLLIVYFLCSLLQGRAKNELAWHIRIQTFFFFVLSAHRYRRGHGSINITSKTTYCFHKTHLSLSQN